MEREIAEKESKEKEGNEPLSPSSQLGRLAQTGGTPESGVEPGNEPAQEPLDQDDRSQSRRRP